MLLLSYVLFYFVSFFVFVYWYCFSVLFVPNVLLGLQVTKHLLNSIISVIVIVIIIIIIV
jgi:hypothetical protein